VRVGPRSPHAALARLRLTGHITGTVRQPIHAKCFSSELIHFDPGTITGVNCRVRLLILAEADPKRLRLEAHPTSPEKIRTLHGVTGATRILAAAGVGEKCGVASVINLEAALYKNQKKSEEI